MIYLIFFIILFSFFLTGKIRKFALDKNILDIPNHRSSHDMPIPRGGGLAFIVAFLMSLPFVYYLGFNVDGVWQAVYFSGSIIAIIGFLDDKYKLPAYIRLLGHFFASALAVFFLGGMPGVNFGLFTISPGFLANSLAVFYLVWLLNLYNFMDGIDGIASIETLSICLGGAILYLLKEDYTFIGLPVALAAAVAGFLWWNFPPARIFMGDAGSGFLGLILGVLSIQAAHAESQLFFCWLILLGVFVVDATYTLLYRLYQGFIVHEAHCSHAYQKAAFKIGHTKVTLSVLTVNMLWLLPVAILVNSTLVNGFTGLLIAYLPIIVLVIGLKAGKVN